MNLLKAMLLGAAAVSSLLIMDAVVFAALDGRWSEIGRAPAVGWGIGVLLGCLGGTGIHLMNSLRAKVRLGKSGEESDERSVIATVPPLVFGALLIILLVQINHRLLGNAPTVSSVLVGFVVLLFTGLGVLLSRALRSSVERTTRQPTIGRPVAVLMAGLIFSALIGYALPEIEPGPARQWKRSGAARSDREASEGTRRLLVLGIDGAHWTTIDPLIKSGRLPHLARLLERGRRGILRSPGESRSPVVWTTLFTGKDPETHGVNSWERSSSRHRRVKTLWNILDELRLETFVLNVPGSFPADPIKNGGMIAGFPLPQWQAAETGWMVRQSRTRSTGGPISVRLALTLDQEVPTRIALRDLPSHFAWESSTPFKVLNFRTESLAVGLARRLFSVTYLDLEVLLHAEPSGGHRLRGREASTGEDLFDLGSGEWSPWLAMQVEGVDCVLRIHAPSLNPGEVLLFATTVFRENPAGLFHPAGLASETRSESGPYLAESTGWKAFLDADALSSLEEHSLDAARRRANAALQLLETTPWDAFAYIFTVTDRIQHPFWKYREPQAYSLASYPRALVPTAEQTARFGGTIDRAYELVDRLLGMMTSHASDSTTILVLSDHGAQSGHNPKAPTAGIHHQDGIYLLAGPHVVQSSDDIFSTGPTLELIDIVPVLLAHLGLPRAEDLPGVVPSWLAPRNTDGGLVEPSPSIPTYETGRTGDEAEGEEMSEEIRQQLRALGYLD